MILVPESSEMLARQVLVQHKQPSCPVNAGIFTLQFARIVALHLDNLYASRRIISRFGCVERPTLTISTMRSELQVPISEYLSDHHELQSHHNVTHLFSLR